jgi:hypothetical protein
MDRRRFFRNSAILAAGLVAADQLELLDRLGWERKLFSGWRPDPRYLRARVVSWKKEFHTGAVDVILEGALEPNGPYHKVPAGKWGVTITTDSYHAQPLIEAFYNDRPLLIEGFAVQYPTASIHHVRQESSRKA